MNKEIQILNRKMYKEIKKMDRQQMEGFLADIYMRGAAEGVERTEDALDVDVTGQVQDLAKLLHKELGIGEKRFARISGQVDDILKGGAVRG